ncbi:GNAT family N-acetyltransferase [Microtetraspora niveoalba]|uniref:GNAT family N-acetyltransferase n=1 Tax=Microtetraspora niveoalba TaxID=46175 RepID=UPI0008302726|nr:GNAT family N-acetyltransferase [Microtetraspora niveoalba]
MPELIIRPLEEGEEELFLSRPDPELLGLVPTHHGYRALSSEGQYRPEWSWVAIRNGLVVARAGWWGGPSDTTPRCLDWFDFDDPADGVALLKAAPYRVEHSMQLPSGWRDDPVLRGVIEPRIAAAEQAGMRLTAQRLRYLWGTDLTPPTTTDRLEFRSEPDDDVILDALCQIMTGTLVDHARDRVETGGVEAAAREELAGLRWYPSPREWWRTAWTRDGELVGLAVPARNHTRPVVGFIGVVAAQRGHGYGYDMLAEITRFLVEQGAEEIAATTDLANIPMARIFDRAGYPIIGEQIDLT